MWGISYWVFPVISGCCWVGMLMGLLIHWTTTGHPHYASMKPDQSIAYISDVGAESLKPLFIAGSCVTTIFLDASFLSERWLRHRGRLVKNTTRTEKVLSALSLVFALIGTAGLILLSIFDTLRHHKLHDTFLLLFIVGYVFSAICICWEYQRLGIHFREHRVLRLSFWIKLFFILVSIALAIGFGATNFKEKYNAAAVLEWAISFVFTFYVFSFIIDLAPAVHTKSGTHFGGSETEMQREANDGREGRDNMDRNTVDSQRTLGENDLRYPKDGAPAGRNF